MERKKSLRLRPKTIKTDKTIATSRRASLVAASRDHSTTLRYSQTTLKLLSPIKAEGRTQKLPKTTQQAKRYPPTLAPNFSFIYNQVLQFDICFVPSRPV